MLKQNQEAQRRYRMRLKLKAAARDAELDSMRSKLENAEGLAVQLYHMQQELEKKNQQMIVLQEAVKRQELAGAAGEDLLSAVCKMNSDVAAFVCKLQDQLQIRNAVTPGGLVPPGGGALPAILSDLGSTFDELVRMVACLDGNWRSLTASARVRMSFEHPSEQSSWCTAAAEAFLSREQISEIQALYRQSIVAMEPILAARQSITNALLGLRAGWNNTVSMTAEIAQQEAPDPFLAELTTTDITMLLSIAHSTQQKFSEMVKNIMQDIRLEANMDAMLLSKILSESQVAKIIMLTRNKMPSVLKLGLGLDKMGAFDPVSPRKRL